MSLQGEVVVGIECEIFDGNSAQDAACQFVSDGQPRQGGNAKAGDDQLFCRLKTGDGDERGRGGRVIVLFLQPFFEFGAGARALFADDDIGAAKFGGRQRAVGGQWRRGGADDGVGFAVQQGLLYLRQFACASGQADFRLAVGDPSSSPAMSYRYGFCR